MENSKAPEQNNNGKHDYLIMLTFIHIIICLIISVTVFFVSKGSNDELKQKLVDILTVSLTKEEVNSVFLELKDVMFTPSDLWMGGENKGEITELTSVEAESLTDEAMSDEEGNDEETTGEDAETTITESEETQQHTQVSYNLTAKAIVPVIGRITSGFGLRVHPITSKESFHTGVDIAAPEGTTVKAAFYGEVVKTGYNDEDGNFATLRHSDSIVTRYCHLKEIACEEGAVLRAGETVGYVGQTGLATGPHLHFELLLRGIEVNPEGIFEVVAV